MMMGFADWGKGAKVATASHILMKDREAALRLRERIQRGEVGFEEAAAQCSTCGSAAQGGALAVAEAMLESDGGAQLNRLDVNGWSALHHACTCGHAKLAMLFFERGADIEKRTRGGRTIADMDAQIAASLQAVLEARREAEAAAAQEAEAA